jgi:transcriptional regulator GlxA family with amidase domain
LLLGPLSREQDVPASYPEPAQRALAHIGRTLRANPAAKIALADLAAAALVSDKHLCRLFAQTLGTSPMDAVMAYRLYQAAQLLVRTDLKLDAVARHGGFATPFHFSRRFKEFYGQPPSLYRAAARTSGAPLPPQVRLGRGLIVEY